MRNWQAGDVEELCQAVFRGCKEQQCWESQRNQVDSFLKVVL